MILYLLTFMHPGKTIIQSMEPFGHNAVVLYSEYYARTHTHTHTHTKDTFM